MSPLKSDPPNEVVLPFAVFGEPLPQVSPAEQALVVAATERVERYYRDTPDAEGIDRRLNDELRKRARLPQDEDR